jgi:hypothetical protein
MKNLSLLTALLLVFIAAVGAQTRTITKNEYDKVFQYAVSETNSAFPFVFTVTTESIKNNKIVSTVTEIDEREAQMRERITMRTVADGKTSQKIQVRVDSGQNYCSEDGATWKRSEYECFGPISIYGPRQPESVEYSVTDAMVSGKPVKVYRAFSVFAPSEINGKRDFSETLSTIDSRGFFINVVDTEGSLDPKTITLKRTQVWDFKTKIKPVVAPTN